VIVTYGPRDLRFAFEALHHLGVRRDSGVQKLDGDAPRMRTFSPS